MKRKIALLALPLVLAALMLGVKWRAEHPPLTKDDLEIRALALKFPLEVHGINNENDLIYGVIQKEDLTQFVDCLYLIPKTDMLLRPNVSRSQSSPWFKSVKLSISIHPPRSVEVFETSHTSFYMNVRTEYGGARKYLPNTDKLLEYDLHPVTIKRWMELLLSHPKIGPELRTRIK